MTHLATAVSRNGGAAAWARRLGLELGSRQDKDDYPDEVAVAEARDIIARLGHLPGANKLRQLGHNRLATAAYHAGGAEAFCCQYGLQ